MQDKVINQILCAALVNKNFQNILLADPVKATACGYLDHSFPLTSEERAMLSDIKANSFEDFASQVHNWISAKQKETQFKYRLKSDLLPKYAELNAEFSESVHT